MTDAAHTTPGYFIKCICPRCNKQTAVGGVIRKLAESDLDPKTIVYRVVCRTCGWGGTMMGTQAIEIVEVPAVVEYI
jgi:transcription elongation factor Elf1